jgi:hypothetical protein
MDFTPQKHYFSASGTHFCYRLSEPQGLVRPVGLGKLKKFTSLGLEPAAFRHAAQCLNHCATACSSIIKSIITNNTSGIVKM